MGLIGFLFVLALGQQRKPPPPRNQPRRHPAPVSAEAATLLSKMRTAYSSVRTAQVSTTFVQYGSGSKVTLHSTCTYQAPLSFRIVTTGLDRLPPSGYVVTTDGKHIRVEGLPGKPFTQPFNERNMWSDLPQLNLEVLCLWDWKQQFSTDRGGNMHNSIFHVSAASWSGKTYTLLEEKAGQVRVLYYIDPATSFIWRTETYPIDSKNPISVCTIEKMEINVPVDAKMLAIGA